MHLHLLQHVNRTAQLFNGHAEPWELIVEDMDLYRGCEDFIDAHGLQEDDVLIFRHVGYFKFHFFVIRNKEQLDLPEAHGDGIERQPAEDGEAIFIPAMSSINLDVGWTTLLGCRTLAIDFIEFCNDKSILSNFIFWTESEGDSVDVRHGTFTLTFINVGEFINYGEQHAFLRRILCRHRNVIRYFVFFNYEVGEVHLIAFDKCGMEIMTDYLYDFTIEEYANADAVHPKPGRQQSPNLLSVCQESYICLLTLLNSRRNPNHHRRSTPAGTQTTAAADRHGTTAQTDFCVLCCWRVWKGPMSSCFVGDGVADDGEGEEDGDCED
nr:hypothetical protein Iba_chr13cCG15000 [Ipomoea batatas]